MLLYANNQARWWKMTWTWCEATGPEKLSVNETTNVQNIHKIDCTNLIYLKECMLSPPPNVLK